VSIIVADILLCTMSQDPDTNILVKYLRRNFPGGIYNCVYEAGFSGFWIYYELNEAGVNCIVINPADVPTTNKEKDRKTDRIDSKKLARCLSLGQLEGIHVFENERYEERSIIRVRESLVKEQTRCKNRIKGLMKFFKVEVTDKDIKSHWSNKYIEFLEKVDVLHEHGKLSLTTYLSQLRYLRKTVSDVTKQIRKLSKTERYKRGVELLCTVPGISILTAMIILTEIGDIGRFRTVDKLCGYIGLIPSEHSSGEKENRNHMTRRGKGILRRIIIEASWIAIRKDPGLLMNYTELTKRMKGNRAIKTISRKMIARIMFVLKNNEPYKFLAK